VEGEEGGIILDEAVAAAETGDVGEVRDIGEVGDVGGVSTSLLTSPFTVDPSEPGEVGDLGLKLPSSNSCVEGSAGYILVVRIRLGPATFACSSCSSSICLKF
jgi:hypothetical protein